MFNCKENFNDFVCSVASKEETLLIDKRIVFRYFLRLGPKVKIKYIRQKNNIYI